MPVCFGQIGLGGWDGAAASTWARSFSHVSKDGYGIQQVWKLNQNLLDKDDDTVQCLHITYTLHFPKGVVIFNFRKKTFLYLLQMFGESVRTQRVLGTSSP